MTASAHEIGPGGGEQMVIPGTEPARAPATAGEELTREQQHAVARRAEPLLVAAAAGSGKTSVLVERFVSAVREDGIAAGRILAITFTERAAGELRARVRARLLDLGDREAARDTEAAFVGTFHAFCARMLRAHPLAAGLDPDFAILDEGLAGRVRDLAFEAALREYLADGRAPAVDLLAAYGVDRVRTMIEQVHRELRSRGQRHPRLPVATVATDAQAPEREAAAACALLDELLDRYAVSYERLKAARAAVDFDDLELLAAELLREREDLRTAWSDRFELLMVDEFQDTNHRQLGILRALDRGNLFTVGDEFQSIYGFRHADVSLFRARRAELAEAGGSLALTWNFRSRAPLLDVVNAVFSTRFSDYTPLTAGRAATPPPGAAKGTDAAARPSSGAAGAYSDASPAADVEQEPTVELLLTSSRGWEEREELAGAIARGLPHASLWRQAEARLLAQRVAEIVLRGQAQAGEVVVLLRSAGDLEVFERALQLRGLRTLAAVGAFWGHQQIGDLLAYLRALANPLDEEALYGVLASPLGGCSRDCLALLAAAARAAGRGAWETALTLPQEGKELREQLSGPDLQALESCCALLAGERATAGRRTISELLQRAIAARGYREHVLGLDWGERRLANIHKLLRLAGRFEASEGRDLRAFLDHVERLEQADAVEPDAPVEGVEPDAVRLMTVHAAKGLEFPVVCVADLGRQPNNRTPDLLVDGERVGLRLVRLDGGDSTPALAYEDLARERKDREAEEEDRILYVAMTRARDRLLLSGAVDFERWPRQGQGATAISWLGPALAQELPALVLAGHARSHDLPVDPAGSVSVRCRLNSPVTVGEVLLLDAADAPAAADTRGDVPPAHGGASERRPPLAADALTRSGVAGAGATRPADAIASLSYSSLSELERCAYRYYLERVLGLGEDRAGAPGEQAAGTVQARARGTLVHRLLETLDFARASPPTPEDVAQHARELGMRVDSGEREEIVRLLAAACAAPPAARIARARELRREYPFAFALGAAEPLITGVIDLLAREPDGVVVLDYKSDRVLPDADLAALVERDYGLQRLLYALAVLRDGAPAVEVVHWFLQRPHEPVGARFQAAERTELEERLSRRLARAWARGYAVSENPHRGLCQTCPGRASLCSWGEAETLREEPAADLAQPPAPPQGT